jgi:hypothetical protein
MKRILFRTIPEEIAKYILEYIEPYLTRDDWRTCRNKEAYWIKRLVQIYEKGNPKNNSHPVLYKDWCFYEKLRFGKVYEKIDGTFDGTFDGTIHQPYLTFCFKMRKIPYFF